MLLSWEYKCDVLPFVLPCYDVHHRLVSAVDHRTVQASEILALGLAACCTEHEDRTDVSCHERDAFAIVVLFYSLKRA